MNRGSPRVMFRVAISREIDSPSKARLLAAKVRATVGRLPHNDVALSVSGRTIFLSSESFAADWAVLKQIFVDREYSTLGVAGARVLDLGAHKGYFAAYALSKGATEVISYEPEPMNLTRLLRSAELSNRWQIRPKAIASKKGGGLLAIDTAWTHRLVGEDSQESRVIEIETIGLADALVEANADVVKIDIGKST